MTEIYFVYAPECLRLGDAYFVYLKSIYLLVRSIDKICRCGRYLRFLHNYVQKDGLWMKMKIKIYKKNTVSVKGCGVILELTIYIEYIESCKQIDS